MKWNTSRIITGEVEGEDATQEKIMSFATKFTLSGKENK